MRSRRAFSVAALVLVLVAMHLLIVRAIVATEGDALASAWSLSGAHAEAALDSALHIAAGELINGRTPPEGPITLPDGAVIEIEVTNDARPWVVDLSARSGESRRSRRVSIG
jgi:hypothetical protein